MNSKALFLFDIDGTLISSGTAPRALFTEIVNELTGIEVSLEIRHVAGLTDPKILEDMLSRAGIPENRIGSVADEFFPIYYKRLKERFEDSVDKKVFEEVPGILKALHKMKNVHIGLLTGNMEQSAMIKLIPFGLYGYFRIGAYASDNSDRNALPPIAVSRAEEMWRQKFDQNEVFVVGDTIHDMRCAVHNNYMAIGVARKNGEEERKKLKSAGASWIFEKIPEAEELKLIANLN
ncbi:MAG: HAD family hydrolase [Candidatus Marinimicrobia bacterium]|nr:HAD family hydrolase [Candidatus Neomarinimicrobiota bacterium]